MPKLNSVGRSRLRQSIVLSFLMIVVSAALTNAACPGEESYQNIVNAICNPASHKVRPLINATKNALSKGKSAATKFFQEFVKLNYTEAMDRQRTTHSWKVLKDIPKNPGTPTPDDFLKRMSEPSTLNQLYHDFLLIRKMFSERKAESLRFNLPKDVATHTDLDKENDKVLEALKPLLPAFKTNIPELPSIKVPEKAEDQNEHQMRNWVAFYEYILLTEYAEDVAKYLMKKYCGLIVS